MFKANTWNKILLVFLSSMITLSGAEVVVRASSKYFLHLFDVEMWRYAREIKSESTIPGVIENHRPEAESKLMGVRIRTDLSGFRRADPNTESLRKPDNLIVVALGDSLTLGWGVPEGQTYPDVLERILNERASQSNLGRFTLINAGIGNSNTSMELARYEHGLRALHPRWLVLGFFINDAEPDPKPVQSTLVKSSALVSLILMRLKPRLAAAPLDYKTYYRSLYEDEKPGWIRLKSALAKLGQELREDNVKATIVLLPEMHEPKNFGPFSDIYQRVAGFANSNGFEVIDASKEFPPGPGNRFWVAVDDAHPNAEAQQIVATAIAKSKHASPGDY
jgi:lysophospholipase L1-like esterase